MTYTPGIDVSRYEGEINWKSVAAAGYRFAVLRATIGDYYTDPRFYSYWTGAKEAGLLVSAYHVVVSTKYADKQIARFFSVLGSRKTDFPVILDIERDDGVSVAANTACIKDCLREINNRDSRKTIIYTAYYYWKDHVSFSSDWAKYGLWVASYNTTPVVPPGWKTWRFWQYTPNGKVPGISSGTDLNRFNGTYQELKNYTGQEPEPSGSLSAQVVATTLNIRSGPSTSYKKLGSLTAGAQVKITNIAGNDAWFEYQSGKWAACFYGGQQYMEILPGDKPSDGIQARVLVDRLNIRSGPAITYADIGDLVKGNTLKISNIGGKDAWVEHGLGLWSAFSYGSDKYMTLA